MHCKEIVAGARTVAHLAIYLEELKQAALELRRRSDARQRGYVTPSEDEEIRHLLVSYWQSRNALFDLVYSLRDDLRFHERERPVAFLVGYAAALLLVDAARFLRETYHGSCRACSSAMLRFQGGRS